MLRRSCLPFGFGCLWLWLGCGPTDQVLESDDSPGMGEDAASPQPDSSTATPDASMTDAQMMPDPPDGQTPGETDAQANPSDAATGAPAADLDCDLNGLWAVRQQTVNVALALPQTANNWYFFELRQERDAVRVVDHFDCGIEVLGTVHVEITPAAVETLLSHNLQIGRTGAMKKAADGTCVLSFERFWSVRGADETRFAPEDRATSDAIETLTKQKPLPTKDKTDGAEDWDSDGELGIAWHVAGIVSGVRHSVQRDFTEWFSDAEFRVTPARDWTSDLVVRSNIGSEEVVLAASSPTIGGSGSPDKNAKHRVTMHFLGRTRDDERARKMLKTNAIDTCLAIRTALPAAQL